MINAHRITWRISGAWRPRIALVLAAVLLAGHFPAPASARAQADVAAVRAGNRATAAGRADQAVAAYRRAVELRPDSALARFNLGTALAALGQSGEAEESLAQAAEGFTRDQDRARAHFNLGNVLARNGRLDDALAAYRASLRLWPDDDARFNYSLVWRWRQAQGEGPAPEEPLAPQRAEELRDRARALDVPVVRKPADRPPVDVDR